MRDLIDLYEWNREEILALFAEAARLKAEWLAGQRSPLLAAKVLGLVFEKPSLRTRVSFQAAMAHLGGVSLFLSGNEVGLGSRETISDFARTMSEYVDGVVLRVYAHQTVEAYAKASTVPVINGLSDYVHPCQALADLFTVQEVFGKLEGRTLAFVGDGNNVARSLAVGCALLGVRFVLVTPEGYSFDAAFLKTYRQRFAKSGLVIKDDPVEAIKSADIVYTDVWTSMGQEAERQDRLRAFATMQLNASLLRHAPAHAKVMHCLPARRGEEISDDVIDGERSIVFQQAGNRMHLQKALLVRLLAKETD